MPPRFWARILQPLKILSILYSQSTMQMGLCMTSSRWIRASFRAIWTARISSSSWALASVFTRHVRTLENLRQATSTMYMLSMRTGSILKCQSPFQAPTISVSCHLHTTALSWPSWVDPHWGCPTWPSPTRAQQWLPPTQTHKVPLYHICPSWRSSQFSSLSHAF